MHRWATGFVQGAGVQPPDGDLERLVGGWPADDGLVAWFRDGHRALVEALSSAPADLDTWTFLDAPTPLAFWARRQAHETAIHRVDAESAAGDATRFPAAFAADGIDELLLRFVSRPGKGLPVRSQRSMVVRATDVSRSWSVTFAPAGFRIAPDPDDTDADLVVTGDVAGLYVMLWNRRDPSGFELDGEVGPARSMERDRSDQLVLTAHGANAEGCRKGTTGSRGARRTSTRDGGVITFASLPVGRARRSV